MPCFSPLSAWQTDSGQIVFAEKGSIRRALSLPCGQCIGCRLERSRQWAVRCVHESQMHDFSSFITLTYDDDHLPVDHSLHYRDFQLFMKRLRKHFDSERQRIRFFMCGEYGELRARPHFHACIFGAFFSDRVLFKRLESGSNLYRSELLRSLWCDPKTGESYGYSSVGDVTFESAAYVARYVVGKVFGDVADERSAYRYVDDFGEVHYREPEFCHMSLKPGIGMTWFDKYYGDVFPRDHVIVGGQRAKVPKYYDRLLAANDFGLDIDSIEFERYKKSLLGAVDASPERLRVREKCAIARLSFKRRCLE